MFPIWPGSFPDSGGKSGKGIIRHLMNARMPPPGITDADWEKAPPAVRAMLRQALQRADPAAPPQPASNDAAAARDASLLRLSQRLEAILAPEEILPAIVETLAQELRLPYVAIALRRTETDAFELAAHSRFTTRPEDGRGLSPAQEPERHVLPLIHHMEIVGQLIVEPRPAIDPLTDREQALLIDIAQRAGTAAHIVRLTNDLRRTRERLVLAREEERRRLRRNLHDSIGPTLAALNLKVGALRNLIVRDPAAAAAQMTELREQIRTVITDIRRVVYDLRPPALDELGMLPAIREQAAQFSTEELRVTVEAPDHLPALPAAVEVATYRIVLEALTNIARHAHAHQGCIRLSLADELQIEVTDDGVGLPPQHRAGVGFTSMRERATELGGTCVVEPRAGGGTRVLARLPLDLKEGTLAYV
jgi:signal transduction histidine kinase